MTLIDTRKYLVDLKHMHEVANTPQEAQTVHLTVGQWDAIKEYVLGDRSMDYIEGVRILGMKIVLVPETDRLTLDLMNMAKERLLISTPPKPIIDSWYDEFSKVCMYDEGIEL